MRKALLFLYFRGKVVSGGEDRERGTERPKIKLELKVKKKKKASKLCLTVAPLEEIKKNLGRAMALEEEKRIWGRGGWEKRKDIFI